MQKENWPGGWRFDWIVLFLSNRFRHFMKIDLAEANIENVCGENHQLRTALFSLPEANWTEFFFHNFPINALNSFQCAYFNQNLGWELKISPNWIDLIRLKHEHVLLRFFFLMKQYCQINALIKIIMNKVNLHFPYSHTMHETKIGASWQYSLASTGLCS